MKSEKITLNNLKIKSFATTTADAQNKIQGGALTIEMNCYTPDGFNDPTDALTCYSLCSCYYLCNPFGPTAARDCG